MRTATRLVEMAARATWGRVCRVPVVGVLKLVLVVEGGVEIACPCSGRCGAAGSAGQVRACDEIPAGDSKRVWVFVPRHEKLDACLAAFAPLVANFLH